MKRPLAPHRNRALLAQRLRDAVKASARQAQVQAQAHAHAQLSELSKSSSMEAEAPRLPRLPACRYCSQKKVKCDSNRPSCTPCVKSQAECVIYDSVGQGWISRAEIEQLEKRIHELSLHHSSPSVVHLTDPGTGDSFPDGDAISPRARRVPSVGTLSTVTRGGGLSFISPLFADMDWRKSNADLLRTLGRAPKATEGTIEPCALPSSEGVRLLFEKYLGWSHVQSPFLLRREVWDLHQRIFSALAESRRPVATDLFRAHMICAIAAVFPYQHGTHSQHPEGYYRAALQHLDSHFLTRGLDSIEDLLLICRLGIYHHIGTSIWDLIRVCARLCVEQGLHCSEGEPPDLVYCQRRRRVFWQVYLIDRYSSSTLDRPFAIDDRDIEVELPVDAADEDLEAAQSLFQDLGSFDVVAQHAQRPNDMTVFLACVKLRKVSTKIHDEFSRLKQDPAVAANSHLVVGHIQASLSRLLVELATWRGNAPVFHQPTCLYESQDWYSLLQVREQLSLCRRAVDIAPKLDGAPPRKISAQLLRAALETIVQYSMLSQQTSFITHTRSYFHMMFTAGLSVMFCISVSAPIAFEDLLEASRGLSTCEATLRKMVERLPDAQCYVLVFEALHRNISRKVQRFIGSSSSGLGSSDLTSTGAIEQMHSYMDPANVPVPAEGNALRSSDGLDSGSAVPSRMSPWAPSAAGQGHFFHPPVNHDPASTSATTAGGGAMTSESQGPAQMPEDILQWAFVSDDPLWNMDAVLGEYVCGDFTTADLFDYQFDPGLS